MAVTDPTVRAKAAQVLAAATPEQQAQVDIDLDTLAWRRQNGTRGWPDDLAEIVEAEYRQGDLKMHALAIAPTEPTPAAPAAPWRPASYCERARHTLRWDEASMSWTLARQHNGRSHTVATLRGFPIDAPPVTDKAARVWADQTLTSLGIAPQEWINKPAPSTAWHTHPRPVRPEVAR